MAPPMVRNLFIFMALLGLTSGCNRFNALVEEKERQKAMDRIAPIEDYLLRHPGFNWEVHNKLRSLYGRVDEKKSMEHVDIILAHSPLDTYMMQILSRWKLGISQDRGIAHLLTWTEKYPQYRYVTAACWMKVGDLYVKDKNFGEAKKYY